VLRLVAEGKTSKEIAVLLDLREQTVRSYRKTMMKKLGVNNVAGLLLADVSIVDRMPSGFSYVTGSAIFDGVPTEPMVVGRTLNWNGLVIAGTQARTLKLLLVVGACLALTSTYLSVTLRSEPVVNRTSLGDFPSRLDEWTGLPAETLEPAVVKVLGVDEYVNRYYAANTSLAHLYIGYYRTQRQGDAIHSPMNCLPGAGWLPVEAGTSDLHANATSVRVNRYIIQKGLDILPVETNSRKPVL
jgi:hypothetical protein